MIDFLGSIGASSEHRHSFFLLLVVFVVAVVGCFLAIFVVGWLFLLEASELHRSIVRGIFLWIAGCFFRLLVVFSWLGVF